MKAGFVLVQLLGHATHGRNLQRVLAGRKEISHWTLQVPFAKAHPLYGRMGEDLVFRTYMDTLRSLGGSSYPADALFFHTYDAALFSPHIVRRVPSVISLDATPLQFKRLNGFDLPSSRKFTVAEKIKVAILRSTRLKMRLVQSILGNARRVVTWSQWAKGSVVNEYGISPEKVTCIPPGVDTQRFAPAERKNSAVTRIVFVGGEFERKGGDLLVKWMRERGLGLGCEIHVVTKSAVEATEGIVVHRDIEPNSDRLIALLQQSDIFALPTRAECFGIALVEAMSVGLAVVSSRITAIPEIIQHGESGILTEAGDYTALAEVLERLVKNPALRLALGGAARKDAERRFTLNNYNELIDCFLEHTASPVTTSAKPASFKTLLGRRSVC